MGWHFNVAPFFLLGASCFHFCYRFGVFSNLLTQHHLRRGLVELFLFILSWAGFHACSIA